MNETVKTILERSSPRKFRPEHIPAEDLELIIKAGLKAPSGMNRQGPRFIVAANDEMREKFRAMNAGVMGKKDADPFYGAPEVVLVAVQKAGTYIYDGSLAAGNMLNAAYALGYGARWIHRCKEMLESAEGKELLAGLGIEEELEGIACIIIGYPGEEMAPKPIVEGRVFYAK